MAKPSSGGPAGCLKAAFLFWEVFMVDFDRFSLAFDEGFDGIVDYEEIEGDLDTPVSILARLLDHDNLFLLESAKEDKTYSRFSFLGFDPEDILPVSGSQMSFNSYRLFKTANLGDFSGGWVGWYGFEAVELFGLLRKPLTKKPSSYGVFFKVDRFLVYDNYTNRLYAAVCYFFDKNKPINENFIEFKNTFFKFLQKIKTLKNGYTAKQQKATLEDFMFSKDEFVKHVAYIVDQLNNGEALQVVLSNFLSFSGIDPFDFYRKLRRINPSPYMFYFKNRDLKLVGSSPEIHLRIRNNVATIRPIAGTKPKTDDIQKIKQQLLEDAKERAEHIMLVDLARNDLARIAPIGSVSVTSFMKPEVYSHVIHIVSNVEADIRDDLSLNDVIASSFPAGTLSGAPKVRAIEFIDEIETKPRQAYGGCIGYVGFDGNADLAITIRTAIFEGGIARLQAGAGIVAYSNPESEYLETINKLKALLRAGGVDDSFDRQL